jgi:DNA-directed RNA polymerase delta subunit
VAVQRDADEQTGLETETERSALWSEVRIDPVEIALPKGVGYTLRAYRPIDDVTPTDVSEREQDEFPERPRPSEADEVEEFDDEYDDLDEVDEVDDEDDTDLDDEESDEDEDEDDESDEDEEADADEDDDDELAAEPDEVPVFLGSAGQLYLFRTVEGLVDFVRSDAAHDMSQLDTWSELVEQITPGDVVPLPEDSYELDLVVENLRAGRDSWDASLLIQAGEVARDLGYALRLDRVVGALAPGSPLDDLDEALRASEAGGVSGFLAKRRLKKIGAEAAPLGWRTIIGKISGVVDWRD